jgi:hypothetical protein
MAEMVRYHDGKKFVWDGEEYDDKKAAASAEQKYKEKDFEVWTVPEGDKVLLYTRRVVTEVVVDGP